MQSRGAIYVHQQLVFHDGEVGKKLLVLLNTPSKNESYLFVKTTSQEKDRPTKSGCSKSRSLFFIPGGSSLLKINTWVQLHEIYEFKPKEIDKDKNVNVLGYLDAAMMDGIIDCLLDAEEDNIPPIHRKLLRPPLQDSLIKLKNLYNKDRN